MSAQIWAALIAAGASLIVAIVTAAKTYRAQQALAQLDSKLQEQRAERDARRDYEYEAKKRLYTQCEPIIFQAMELAENFRHRVLSLARSARTGDLLPDGSGWLASTEEYFFTSTAFFLLAPAVPLRIIQRRLTTVDLALEPRIKFQYQLLKLVFQSYTWDYDLAALAPGLDYRPDKADPGKKDREQLLDKEPSVYRRQGLYLGIVDQLADALVNGNDDSYYCSPLSEFCTDIGNSQTALGRLSGDISGLIQGFHPATEPVLWRLLVTQYLLLGVFLRTGDSNVHVDSDWRKALQDESQAAAQALDWRTADHQAASVDASPPLVMGREYLIKKLTEAELTR
jgi:hypothetical protein